MTTVPMKDRTDELYACPICGVVYLGRIRAQVCSETHYRKQE